MSTFNRNTLALALAAALLPASAFAFNVTTAADTNPETIAAQLGTTVTTTQPFLVSIEAGDNIIGRTQGFNVKLTLLDGAKFNVTPAAPTVGSALVAWNSPVGVAGGAPGSSVIQFLLSNDGTTSQFVNVGDLLSALTFDLQSVSTTGLTRVLVELVDSGTGNVINNGSSTFSFTSNLIVRNNGIAFSCDTSVGDLGKRIDVASDNTQASKTLFTPGPVGGGTDAFGAIGSSLGTAGESFFNAGQINAAVSGGFAFVAGDTLDVTLSGVSFLPEFDAPGAIFLSTTANCATPGAVPGVINMAGTQATFTFDPTVAATALPMFVCLDATGTDVIDQSALAVTATFTRGTDPALTLGAGCDLLPLQFNGSVVKVFTFNPAGNTTQESFLRVSNWGNTGGKVTVEGWDDAGAAGASDITFTLPAGESLQFNSGDVENGNATKFTSGAFGDGAGKWRLVVTGEFDGMNVTSLNRNNTVGTLTNLTDSDNGGEQKSDSK